MQLLSPAEEFKLEVESLRAVQLLEAGNIQGIPHHLSKALVLWYEAYA